MNWGMLVLVAGGCGAQALSSWRAPVGGFHYDALRSSLRPIFGIIGAAQLGPAWIESIDSAAASPDGRFAVVEREGTVYWVPDLNPPVALERRLETSPLRGIRWSVDSSRAVFLHRDAVSWWSREGLNLVAGVRWPLTSSNWEILAAEPGGRVILLVEQPSEGDRSLWLASATQPPRRLDSAPPQGAAFLGREDRAAVLTEGGVVKVWFDLTTAPRPEPLLTLSSLQPGLVAAAPDGQRLFFLSRDRRSMRTLTMESQELSEEQPLGFDPVRLDAVGRDQYLLNRRTAASDPLQILDAALGRIFFVPAGG